MAIHNVSAKTEPRRDPIDEPGRKHGDRAPEVIDPPDPRRHDPPAFNREMTSLFSEREATAAGA